MAFKTIPLSQRLRTNVRIEGDCWIWTGDRYPKGYGRIRVNGKRRRAHRVSYEVHCGPIPCGLDVLHSCDTPACIAPAHLRLGTHLDNMRDMRERGRGNYLRGENSPHSKLTSAMVAEIRSAYRPYDRKNGTYALARRFNVHRKSIAAVISGKTWNQ